MEMIDALTYGLGSELGKPIRQTFFQQKEQMLRLINDKRRHSLVVEGEARWQLFMTDMLALAIFHQRVIMPLHGAGNFYTGTKKLGVKQIAIGTEKWNRSYFLETAKIAGRFFAITQEFGIDTNKLNVSSLADFITTWSDVYHDS